MLGRAPVTESPNTSASTALTSAAVERCGQRQDASIRGRVMTSREDRRHEAQPPQRCCQPLRADPTSLTSRRGAGGPGGGSRRRAALGGGAELLQLLVGRRRRPVPVRDPVRAALRATGDGAFHDTSMIIGQIRTRRSPPTSGGRSSTRNSTTPRPTSRSSTSRSRTSRPRWTSSLTAASPSSTTTGWRRASTGKVARSRSSRIRPATYCRCSRSSDLRTLVRIRSTGRPTRRTRPATSPRRVNWPHPRRYSAEGARGDGSGMEPASVRPLADP